MNQNFKTKNTSNLKTLKNVNYLQTKFSGRTPINETVFEIENY